VQSRGFDYIVDISNKTCDCRRWDLTGIPCNHAIACLRDERIPAEDMLPSCYSTETYSIVYAFNIMPCRDKTMWEKMNGPPVQPPVYEKKVERPPKSRRKQPTEVQGRARPKLSKHRVIITCSWCKGENHNSAGCALKKLGIRLSVHRNTAPTHNEETPIHVDNQSNEEATISQVMKHILPQKHKYYCCDTPNCIT
jgi:hypothetical protein